MSFSPFFRNLWDRVRTSQTFVPTYIEFPPEKTDKPDSLRVPFDDRLHYFSVSVNEMFLSYDRKWHMNFSPMVFSVCSFAYDGKSLEIPYMIGPNHLEKYQQRVPKGMLFLNTPVVGIHPWKGGNVSLSLILCRVQQTNNIEKILKVVEDVSNSLDFSTGLSNYVKIGQVVLNGVDSLLGFQQTSPLLGISNNFGQAAGNPFKPGYYALIHNENADRDKFWVKENRLCYGNNLSKAEPYREDDFILFQIGQSTIRRDEESLGYYDDYRSIYEYLKNQVELSESQKANLKARLRQLAVAIKLSPDLTNAHADQVWREKKEEIENFVKEISDLGDRAAPGVPQIDEIDAIMNQAVSELNF